MAHVTRDAHAAAFAVTTAAAVPSVYMCLPLLWYDFLTGKGKWLVVIDACHVSRQKEKKVEDEAGSRLGGRGFGLILGSFRS